MHAALLRPQQGDETREATETECTLAYLPPSRSLLSQGDEATEAASQDSSNKLTTTEDARPDTKASIERRGIAKGAEDAVKEKEK